MIKFASVCQWTYRNLPAHSKDMITLHQGPRTSKMLNLGFSKWTGFQYIRYF